MKKILLILAVFTLAAPTMAAVSVSVSDNGDCTADINFSMAGESSRVRAWALTVTVDGGAVITAVTPAVVGENDAINKGFWIFPGTIVITGGAITDVGTPVAPASDPGAAGTGIGTSTVILEMGSLYVDSNNPADTGPLAVIEVDQACNVTITAEETYRGGIVREDSSQVSGASLATGVAITCAPLECAGKCYPGCVEGGPNSTEYDEWLSVGEPASWCFPKQCHGDADGLDEQFGRGNYVSVGLADVIILLAGYNDNSYVDPATDPWIAADFTHSDEQFGRGNYVRVGLADVVILLEYYNDEQSTVPANCP